MMKIAPKKGAHMGEFFSTEVHVFSLFLRENRWTLAISSALFLCLYGPWLFNINPRFDTPVVLNDPHTTYNWLDIGRYGLLFSENIWNISAYNPFIYTFFGFVMVSLGAILYGYLFWRAGRGKGLIFSFFVFLGFVQPILTEQYYFDLQLFQIGWAYVITAVACGLAHIAITRKSISAGAIAVFCMIWSFSSYQAFVTIYVASVIGVFLFSVRRRVQSGKAIDFKVCIRYIGLHIGLFLLAFLLNTWITKLWFTGSDYLTGQVFWGSMDFSAVIDSIIRATGKDMIGDGVFYSHFFIPIVLLVLLSAVLDIRGNDTDFGSKVLYVAACFVLQLCPFLLIFFMGREPTIHAQLAYPFVLGLDLLLLLTHHYRRKLTYACVCICSVALIWSQIQTTERLVYTDVIRAQDDILLATEIETVVHSKFADKAVAFVGSYSGTLNSSCQRGELIGLSIFNICNSVGTKYWNSSSAACECLKPLGFTLSCIPEEKMMDARVVAADMPSWPEEGSIVDAGEFIVVKLSEDEWPEEVNEYSPGAYRIALSAEVSEDCSTMTITLLDHEDVESILFPVWSDETGQDDLIWYDGVKQADGSWTCTVDLAKHHSKGNYSIHAYEKTGEDLLIINTSSAYVEFAV